MRRSGPKRLGRGHCRATLIAPVAASVPAGARSFFSFAFAFGASFAFAFGAITIATAKRSPGKATTLELVEITS